MIGTTRELPIENEERKPPEVIPVEVGDEDCIYLVGVDSRSLERDERRGTAVDEAGVAIRFSQDASLQATAATERVARSQESNSHACHDVPRCSLTPGFTGVQYYARPCGNRFSTCLYIISRPPYVDHPVLCQNALPSSFSAKMKMLHL